MSAKTRVTYSADGRGAEGADVAVVVVGEAPYAEGVGDRADLSLSADDVAVVDAIAAASVPIVVVVYSGRPLILGRVLDRADAVVAAWLPGTEGRGVADVLFGDYAPRGKLGFTWPRVDGPDPDERRRRELRPAVPVRLRAHLRAGAEGAAAPQTELEALERGGYQPPKRLDQCRRRSCWRRLMRRKICRRFASSQSARLALLPRRVASLSRYSQNAR